MVSVSVLVRGSRYLVSMLMRLFAVSVLMRDSKYLVELN